MVYKTIYLILQTICKDIKPKLQIIANSLIQKYEYFLK